MKKSNGTNTGTGHRLIQSRVFAGIQKELVAKYEIASSIRHRGEKGKKREFGVSSFLAENLPLAYAVATGELFSFKDDTSSPQCDVVIYDGIRTPVIGRSSPVQQIPIEGAYAVIEVKSTIDAAALRDASAKFEKIRSLWDRARPENEDIDHWRKKGPTCIIFGFNLGTTVDKCLEFAQATPRKDVGIVSLDSGGNIYVGDLDDRTTWRSVWLDLNDPNANSYYALTFFFFSILEICGEERPKVNYHDILIHTLGN